jgi:cyclic pyranopterin phosphate synthase
VTESENPRPPGPIQGLTHLDAAGQARMVDVSQKGETLRRARARARVELGPDLRRMLFEGRLPKGEALGVVRIAGIQGAKETARLVPLCHPLALSGVEIGIERAGDGAVEITAEVRCTGPTGVEMEALTAVSVAALALYDMCKAVRKGIRIGPIELLEKSGGTSGDWRRGAEDGDA